MEELKPCPFCGEKPDKRFYFKDLYFGITISCKKCHTSKEGSVYLEGGYSYVNPAKKFIDAEEKAIKLWNQRSNDGALQQEITCISSINCPHCGKLVNWEVDGGANDERQRGND